MLGELVDDDEEENINLSGNNEVLINNIKCEVCKIFLSIYVLANLAINIIVKNVQKI